MSIFKRIWAWLTGLFQSDDPVEQPKPEPKPKPEPTPEPTPEPDPEPDPEPVPEPESQPVYYDFYDENRDGVIDYGPHKGRRYDIHSKTLRFLD